MAACFFTLAETLGNNAFEIPAEVVRQIQSGDLYQRLGLKPDATDAEINRAYRATSRSVHPDKDGANVALRTELMQKVNEARDILRNPARKKQYDQDIRPRFSYDYQEGEYAKSDLAREINRNSPREFSGLFNGTYQYRDANEPVRPEVASEIQVLEALQSAHPELRTYVQEVIDKRLKPKLRPTVVVMFQKVSPLWPSDAEKVKLMIAQGTPALINEISISLQTVAGWDERPDFLEAVIDRGYSDVNSGIAEFFYYPKWIDAEGARLLHKLVDQGHGSAALRALSLASDEQWAKSEFGQDVMVRIIQAADRDANLQAEILRLFDGRHGPWPQLLDQRFPAVNQDIPLDKMSWIPDPVQRWRYFKERFESVQIVVPPRDTRECRKMMNLIAPTDIK